MDRILKGRNQKVDHVISLEISSQLILERLTGRRWAPQSRRIYHVKNNPPQKEGFCDKTGEALVIREDDREEVVRSRLEIFQKQDRILRGYYDSKGVLKKVSAEGSPEEIFQKILPHIEG